MDTGRHELGMIGLGVMGRNMLLNMTDHSFPVVGYDMDANQVEALQKESAASAIHALANIQDFIGLLRRPRADMTALAYFDGYRSTWLPANLIQAQRNYFGAHSYERIDVEGTFHTDWTKG